MTLTTDNTQGEFDLERLGSLCTIYNHFLNISFVNYISLIVRYYIRLN